MEKELKEQFYKKFVLGGEIGIVMIDAKAEGLWQFISQALQATREETIKKIREDCEELTSSTATGYFVTEDFLDSLKAQKKGIRR